MPADFSKVLAANRGEIAIRIFRACYDLGMHTMAMYSNEDMYALFRTKADEAYLIGENKSPLGAFLKAYAFEMMSSYFIFFFFSFIFSLYVHTLRSPVHKTRDTLE